MVSRLRDRLGTAGLIVAIVALVAALGGGAYAASGLNGKQKKEVSKAAKKESKKFSKKFSKQFAKPGPAGAAGPAGPQGPQGLPGGPGQNGTNGTNGTNGAAGKSVVLVNEEPEGCPGEEGATYEVEGSEVLNEVCRGEEGEQGPQGDEGSPWVVGQAPTGAVLKGTWAIPQFTATAVNQLIPVAFSTAVPIGSLSSLGGIIMPPGPADPEQPNGCTGTADAPVPGNTPGVMCVYQSAVTNLANPTPISGAKVRTSGGGQVLLFKAADPNGAEPDPESWEVSGYGSWAVKAP
jgi:hypothetical protein